MTDRSEQEDKALENLLRLAGERDSVPEEREERVYRRVHDEWRASTRKPDQARVYGVVHREWAGRWRRRLWLWTVPAIVATSILIGVLVMRSPEIEVAVQVATVARISGDAGSGTGLAPGDTVHADSVLTTGRNQGISVILAGGESLRVDEFSSIRLASRNQLHLLAGRIYADSGDFIYRDGNLLIQTPLGSVRDIGTQFSVAVESGELEVGVREGRVDVSSAGETFVAIGGERLRLNSGNEAEIDAIGATDSYWTWAMDLAPSFDIENKSLLDFLKWACRELGLELVFPDNELRLSVMRTNLHGSIDGFDIREAVESVMATTGLHYRFETDRLVVER